MPGAMELDSPFAGPEAAAVALPVGEPGTPHWAPEVFDVSKDDSDGEAEEKEKNVDERRWSIIRSDEMWPKRGQGSGIAGGIRDVPQGSEDFGSTTTVSLTVEELELELGDMRARHLEVQDELQEMEWKLQKSVEVGQALLQRNEDLEREVAMLRQRLRLAGGSTSPVLRGASTPPTGGGGGYARDDSAEMSALASRVEWLENENENLKAELLSDKRALRRRASTSEVADASSLGGGDGESQQHMRAMPSAEDNRLLRDNRTAVQQERLLEVVEQNQALNEECQRLEDLYRAQQVRERELLAQLHEERQATQEALREADRQVEGAKQAGLDAGLEVVRDRDRRSIGSPQALADGMRKRGPARRSLKASRRSVHLARASLHAGDLPVGLSEVAGTADATADGSAHSSSDEDNGSGSGKDTDEDMMSEELVRLEARVAELEVMLQEAAQEKFAMEVRSHQLEEESREMELALEGEQRRCQSLEEHVQELHVLFDESRRWKSALLRSHTPPHSRPATPPLRERRLPGFGTQDSDERSNSSHSSAVQHRPWHRLSLQQAPLVSLADASAALRSTCSDGHLLEGGHVAAQPPDPGGAGESPYMRHGSFGLDANQGLRDWSHQGVLTLKQEVQTHKDSEPVPQGDPPASDQPGLQRAGSGDDSIEEFQRISRELMQALLPERAVVGRGGRARHCRVTEVVPCRKGDDNGKLVRRRITDLWGAEGSDSTPAALAALSPLNSREFFEEVRARTRTPTPTRSLTPPPKGARGVSPSAARLRVPSPRTASARKLSPRSQLLLAAQEPTQQRSAPSRSKSPAAVVVRGSPRFESADDHLTIDASQLLSVPEHPGGGSPRPSLEEFFAGIDMSALPKKDHASSGSSGTGSKPKGRPSRWNWLIGGLGGRRESGDEHGAGTKDRQEARRRPPSGGRSHSRRRMMGKGSISWHGAEIPGARRGNPPPALGAWPGLGNNVQQELQARARAAALGGNQRSRGDASPPVSTGEGEGCCPSCQTPYATEANFCRICGTKRPGSPAEAAGDAPADATAKPPSPAAETGADPELDAKEKLSLSLPSPISGAGGGATSETMLSAFSLGDSPAEGTAHSREHAGGSESSGSEDAAAPPPTRSAARRESVDV